MGLAVSGTVRQRASQLLYDLWGSCHWLMAMLIPGWSHRAMSGKAAHLQPCLSGCIVVDFSHASSWIPFWTLMLKPECAVGVKHLCSGVYYEIYGVHGRLTAYKSSVIVSCPAIYSELAVGLLCRSSVPQTVFWASPRSAL